MSEMTDAKYRALNVRLTIVERKLGNSLTVIGDISGGPASMSVLGPAVGATYTVPTAIRRLKVRVQGPGGGGGGADQGVGTSGAGAGGGAGGYAEKLYDVTPGQTFTYTVGTGGTGGAAGQNSGNPGSTATVFDSAGSPVTGNVGSGGTSMATGTGLNGAAGGAGGTATGGDINITGQSGDSAIRFAVADLLGGRGGSSQLGRGGHYITNGASGPNATGYGAGGAGIAEFANQTDRAGGDGANGVIIIEEYN